MKKNNLLAYTIMTLSMLISLPGRFAYGLLAVLTLIILTGTQAIISSVLKSRNMNSYVLPLSFFSVIGMTVVLKQLLFCFSPVLALSIGFNLYLIAGAVLVSDFIGNNFNSENSKQFKNAVSFAGKYALLVLIYFLIRDIVAYGTVTIPSPDGLFILRIFRHSDFTFPGNFFGTIPGGLMLVAIIIIIISFIARKLEVVRVMNTQEKAIKFEKQELKQNISTENESVTPAPVENVNSDISTNNENIGGNNV